jgi:hypothetical protein
MKKQLITVSLIASFALFSPLSYADHDDWEGRDRYPPQQQAYYAQPPVNYYPPQPRYYRYDQRSHQGLAGSIIGNVLAYQLGSGDPLIAGLGAAAGAFFGNGFRAGY